MIKIVPTIKLATTAVVGFGTTAVVKAIISNNVPRDDMNILEEGAVIAGSYALGAMVADHTRNYTDAQIDKAVTWYNDHIKKTA
jgi:hypothetical protein